MRGWETSIKHGKAGMKPSTTVSVFEDLSEMSSNSEQNVNEIRMVAPTGPEPVFCHGRVFATIFNRFRAW